MSKQTEALKLALSVLDEVRSETFRLLRNGQKLYAEEKVWNAIFVIKQALAEQPAQQEPVACAVCNEVHTILDTDESKIIRSAADGYPEGRTPRVLTLQERVIALCVYAADWKRWCIEKENASPAQQQEPVAWKDRTYGNLHHQDFGNSIPLYTSPPASKPLTDEQIAHATAPVFMGGNPSLTGIARAIESAHGIKEKNT